MNLQIQRTSNTISHTSKYYILFNNIIVNNTEKRNGYFYLNTPYNILESAYIAAIDILSTTYKNSWDKKLSRLGVNDFYQ